MSGRLPWQRAVDAVERRAVASRADDLARARDLFDDAWPALKDEFVRAGRLTINFHPDRITPSGVSVAEGLVDGGRYVSQFVTGISNGGRSAIPAGERHRWEHELFDGAYDDLEPVDRPVYGAFDLTHDPHGGSPRFGSSYLVLRPEVLARATLCVGDSHAGPADVGTADAILPILVGTAERRRPEPGPTERIESLRTSFGDGIARRDLDDYVEAQVHGGVRLDRDVEAVVLDPSYIGTQVGDVLAAGAEVLGFDVRHHLGSELVADECPADFRGPSVAELATVVARPDGIVDAAAIGRSARPPHARPSPAGDPPESPLQQLKYLWHCVFAFGDDAQLTESPPT